MLEFLYQNFDSISNIQLLQEATSNFHECFGDIVDYEIIQEEIKKNNVSGGDLDITFKKYCDRRDEVIQCGETYLESIDPCLTEEEREQKTVAMTVVKSLLDFVCQKNGSQIASKLDPFSLRQSFNLFSPQGSSPKTEFIALKPIRNTFKPASTAP
jgi:hypothetical protein